MSKSYIDLTETNFPQAIDTFDRATDVTLDLLPLVKEYQTLYNNGKLNEASQLLISHPELQNCMINAKTINRCYDGIKALQRYYFSDIQKYIEQLITYRGEYSNKIKYDKYDVCLYNRSAYLCISDQHQVGILPTEQTYFVQITLQGEQGIAGINLTFEGIWNATVTYSSDSCVTYNNVLYASLIDNNLAKTPSKNSSYWTVVIDFDLLTTYDNSVSGLNSVSLQNAIDEVNVKVNTNKTNISTNTSSINTINTKLNGIENGAQVNKVTGVKGDSESSYRTGNINLTKANIGLGNVDNTSDSTKSVKYATSAGSAGTCTGNSATATYATSAGNSDTVDGFHFVLSTDDLTAGTSTLATNTFCFVYE